MERYICRPITELPGYMQVKFRVQEGMVLNAGQIYVGEKVDTELGSQNYDTFIPEEISDTTKQIPSILINNEFEQLPDGRRPDGQPDYSQYYFTEGEVVTAISLLPETKYELSYDSIIAESEIKVGGVLYPEEGSSRLMYVDDLYGVNSRIYLKIEALKFFRLGGAFGSQFANTMVVRVKEQKANGEQKINITAEITPNLVAPVSADTVVAKVAANGGEEPYIYSFINGGEDNSLFNINSKDEITITPKADLDETRTYKVMIGATDKDGNKATTTLNIMVDSPAITGINLTMTKDIRQGEASTQPGGLIATVAVTGGTAPYTISLGGTNAQSFVTDGMTIKTGLNALLQGNYNIKVIATDNKGKVLSKDVIIEVLQPYPDIDSVTLNIEDGLQAPVIANTIVGHIQVLGGTAPYTITLPAGVQDNDLFTIEDAIKNKESITTGGAKNITVRVVDTHNKVKEASAIINIGYPNITSVEIEPIEGLVAPIAIDTKVADITSSGGTPPITYFMTGSGQSSFFKIYESQILTGIELEGGDYNIGVRAKDSQGKMKIGTAIISVTEINPEITSVTVKPVTGLTVPVAVDTKVADITSEGGTIPITYSLPAGVSNNDSFKISGTQVLVKTEITDAGSYAVVVKATDSKNKTKNSVTTAFLVAAGE